MSTDVAALVPRALFHFPGKTTEPPVVASVPPPRALGGRGAILGVGMYMINDSSIHRRPPAGHARQFRVPCCRERGFTYVELIGVIVILAILMALLLPGILTMRGKSDRAACEFNLLTLGMALKAYADDYKIYPIYKPLVAHLQQSNYISGSHTFRCPKDSSVTGDTYSVGYLGGHPATIRPTDPLIVCGWHPRIGTLAVFPDTSVGILDHLKKDESQIVPITVTRGSEDVEPGFQLHSNDAVVVSSADGNQALIYGKNGPYFISASYDPSAYGGTGLFTVIVGFDTSSSQNQNVSANSSTAYVEIQTSFEYCNVVMLYDPLSPNPMKLSWQPGALLMPTQVTTEYFRSYRIAHNLTGQFYDVDYTGDVLDKYDESVLLIAPVE